MNATMGRINELIRNVREHYGLTLEHMATVSDCSVSAISRYELGEREVSARYLRSLFTVTRAGCLVGWFDGQLYEALQHRAPAPVPPPKDINEILPLAIEAMKRDVARLEYVQRIVNDGKVDEESDGEAIDQALAEGAASRLMSAELERSLLYWRHQSNRPGKGNGSSR